MLLILHLKKNYKINFFVEKNEAKIIGFAVLKKAPSPWKNIFEKKSSSLFVQVWSSKKCAEYSE